MRIAEDSAEDSNSSKTAFPNAPSVHGSSRGYYGFYGVLSPPWSLKERGCPSESKRARLITVIKREKNESRIDRSDRDAERETEGRRVLLPDV